MSHTAPPAAITAALKIPSPASIPFHEHTARACDAPATAIRQTAAPSTRARLDATPQEHMQ